MNVWDPVLLSENEEYRSFDLIDSVLYGDPAMEIWSKKI
jgi:hypothetical protein